MKKYKALIDDYCMSDLGASGHVFPVQCLTRDKIYTEYKHTQHDIPCILDDDGNTVHINTGYFKKNFIEVL